MSAFTGLASGTSIPMGNGPTTGYRNTLPINAAGGVVAANGPVASWLNGVPYTASGEVAVNEVGIPVSWIGGVPLDAEGRICVTTSALTHWAQGMPFGSAG